MGCSRQLYPSLSLVRFARNARCSATFQRGVPRARLEVGLGAGWVLSSFCPAPTLHGPDRLIRCKSALTALATSPPYALVEMGGAGISAL
jgi:hypothetical protein